MSQVNFYQSLSTQNSIQFANVYSQLECPQQIVFIDSNVDDYQSLANGVLPKTKVVILDRFLDGVQQITRIIKKYRDISSIHIVSHGAPGCLYLGNSQLNIKNINDYWQELETWPVTNLLLYGCSVAAGDAGTEFLAQLQKITGANIAASAKPTGNLALGGNWELEVIRGELEVSLVFSDQIQSQWEHILADEFEEKPELFQVISGQLFRLNLLTASYEPVIESNIPSDYNAGGFATNNDNVFIYAVGTGTSNRHHLLRVFSDGTVENVTDASNNPITITRDSVADANKNKLLFSGDVDADQNLWIVDQQTSSPTLIKVDLNNPSSGTRINLSGTLPPNKDPNDKRMPSDVVYIEADEDGDGIKEKKYLYGLSDQGRLVRVDITNANESNPAPVTTSENVISGLNTSGSIYGAAWTDIDGNLFVSVNSLNDSSNQGTLYHIKNYDTAPEAEELFNTIETNSNDGMSNPTQKSPFVIPLIDLDGTDTSEELNYATTFTEDLSAVGIVDTDIIIRDYINTDDNGTPGDTSDDETSTTHGDRLVQATITLTDSPDGDDEKFLVDGTELTNSVVVSGTTTSITATLGTNSNGQKFITLAPTTDNTASVDDFEIALKAIQYKNDSQNPDITDRTLEIVLEDENGNKSSDIFGENSTTVHTTTIEVIRVNDAPIFSNLDANPTFNKGGNAVVLDADATIADHELDNRNNNYYGAILTLARNGGANSDDNFSASGTLSALTEGGDLEVDGTIIGTVTTNSGGTLLLIFNNNATTALVNSALQQIAYSNSSDTPPTSVQIDYTFNDCNTGDTDQGTGGYLTANGSVTVTIAPNQNPTAVDDSTSTNTGTPVTFNITGNDSDPDDGTVNVATVDLDPSTDGRQTTRTVEGEGTYSVDDSGNVTFTPEADFVGTTTGISYTVADQNGGVSNEATITVTVNNQNPTAVDDSTSTNTGTPVTFN
ncbi:DUF4347 domain-containing protein, partial [Okeania sp.]|uniref:DUF4347 domain-containing protein n=1 Tax=Okeania sp. TaxID=3100323 RepID=UPI002B4B13E2